MSNIAAAGRLIYLAQAASQMAGKKKGKAIVRQRQNEYAELMQRYRGDEEFTRTVDELIEAMELRVIRASSEGLHLTSANADAMWAPTISLYKNQVGRSDESSARLLICHLAIGLVVFPEPDDLERPVEDLGVLTLTDTIEIIRRFSEKAKELPEDEELLHPLERNALLDFAELPEIRPDAPRSKDSWRGLIQRVIDHLVDMGYLLRFGGDHGVETEYRVTDAYQVAFEHAVSWLFTRYRDLLKTEPNAQNPDAMEAH